ncbi:hypothetical protein HY933_00365 [Candidatus Falkowbacteria bacterium]|nr:hypothetical protein [Candidatus Falkowbacteria bacterium]
MEQYTCSATSAGEGVNFFSNVDLYPHFSREGFTQEHLDLVVSRGSTKTPFQIHYRDGADETLVYHEQEALAVYPWNKMCHGQTLMYAAYPFIELQRQMNGYVTAHSAAVELGGASILLLGKIGAGKTSIAIDLCRRYGASLIGNDITIVGLQDGTLCLKGGTEFFFLRYESIKRNLPDLLRFFPADPVDTWLQKQKIQPEEIGAKIKRGKSSIRKVYLVHVDEKSPSIFIEKDDSLVTKLFLNENFSRYIRGTCLAMFGGEKLDLLDYIPSYDNIRLYEFRKKFIAVIMREIFYISGPLQAVTDYIAKSI